MYSPPCILSNSHSIKFATSSVACNVQLHDLADQHYDDEAGKLSEASRRAGTTACSVHSRHLHCSYKGSLSGVKLLGSNLTNSQFHRIDYILAECQRV